MNLAQLFTLEFDQVLFRLHRYFPLLIKFSREDSEATPLPFIMQLLLNPKSHGSVLNAIMDFIDKLLSWEDVTMDDDTPIVPLPLDNLLSVDEYDIKGRFFP